MISDAEVLAFLNNPGNFLYAVAPGRRLYQFVPAAREALSALPFLDQRTLGQSSRKGGLAAGRISAALAAPGYLHQETVCDFLFHPAFCCSTLVARALDAPGSALALKEPLALLGLSALKRNARQEASLEPWLSNTLALLSRPFAPGEKVVIKPSNGANNILPEVLHSPRTGKMVVLFGPLEDFLASVICGGRPRAAFIDQTLALFRKDFGAGKTAPEPASPLERAALTWGLQMQSFRKALEAAPAGKAKSLDAARFLDAPEATLAKLDGFYRLGLGRARIAANLKQALGRHAKESAKPFSPAERAAEQRAVKREHRAEISAAVEFAKRNGLGFAQGLPGAL